MISLLQKNTLLRKLYFEQTDIDKALLLFSAFSVSLLMVRIVYTDDLRYLTLTWNLFLAWLPYACSTFMQKRPQWTSNWVKLGAALVIWLLLIPNSFYIITDLFHLRKRASIPVWFDLALIFSFAWSALIMGILSVRHIERIIHRRYRIQGFLLIIPLMFVIAFGIYIGRYMRYNSWDVLTNPFQLVRDIADLITRPLHYRFDWSMVLCYGVLLSLIYLTLIHLSRNLAK